ncbi:ABC transporter substrate-binding protein [Pseudohongiella sp. SYSU M77423]|uniref:ABC transporter substrate-binding protein n=1 Tax=Pseudohongiella sp. SYSU M77423 TaxID=3042312 RepID=UPI00248025D9|nr:ABC transporter substrate-binding protein [Pseudohongiella sp. SYSU M77423]MDH7943675.1 ABC transporter substrate-binding protein [Pseudohongiella sp. SYSU M77423]
MKQIGLIYRSALLSVSLLLVACMPENGGYVDNAPPADPGPPVYGGQLRVALEGETNNWLPGRGNHVAPAALTVAMALFDPLVRLDHEGQFRPYLAESVTPNESYDQWTVRLRPGVVFHDGTPLDADAIKWNFDNLHKRQGSVTFGSIRDIDRVEVIDELTVVYHLTQTVVPFPDMLTRAVGWPVSPTAVQQYGEEAGLYPVGTGPFKLVSWRRDDRLVLERNEQYWREGLPYLDGITFRPLPDEDARVASLISGDMDAIQTLRQHIVDRLRRMSDIHLYEQLGNSSGSAIFNAQRPPVDDYRVRQALAWAVDPAALVEVLGGRGISPVQTQYFNENSVWYSERVAEAWPQRDQQRARELVQSYVNDPDRSDGLPVGTPISLELMCLPEQSLQDLAQMYQALWNAVGFDVRLRQVEQATQIQSVISGDYMTTCWRTSNEQDPYITLNNDFGPVDIQPLNYTNFTHPLIEEKLAILRTEPEFEIRKAAVEDIMMLLTEQVPNTWTGSTPSAVAAQPRVRNLRDWTFPDGTLGDGMPVAQVSWAQVWMLDDEAWQAEQASQEGDE